MSNRSLRHNSQIIRCCCIRKWSNISSVSRGICDSFRVIDAGGGGS